MVNDVNWLEPWDSFYTESSSFEKKLYKEVGREHILYGKKVSIIGRRYDRDDFLYYIHDSGYCFAVVHLTYANEREHNPNYPRTKVFKDLDEWVNKCMLPNHSKYMLCEEE